MTTELLLGEKKKELDEKKQDLKLVTLKYPELELVCAWLCCKMCTHVLVYVQQP